MPEATALYTVTAIVVAGLVAWVVASLKMAKEPWARPEAAAAIAAKKADDAQKADADVPVEPPAPSEEKKEEEKKEEEPAADEKKEEPAAEATKEEEKKEEEEKKTEA